MINHVVLQVTTKRDRLPAIDHWHQDRKYSYFLVLPLDIFCEKPQNPKPTAQSTFKRTVYHFCHARIKLIASIEDPHLLCVDIGDPAD